MEEKINAIFFGLNLNQKPSEIVKQSNIKFEKYITKLPGVDLDQFSTTIFTANFASHPFFTSKITEGRFDIEYNTQEEHYGVFKLVLVIHFTNESDQLNEYEKLVSAYKSYSSKTEVESTKKKNQQLKSQVTIYQIEKKYKIPNLSFYFDQVEKNKYPIIIEFVTSWKNEELRKFFDEKRKG